MKFSKEQADWLFAMLDELPQPWPTKFFGDDLPKEDWAKLREFAKSTLGYEIDRISADLCRCGRNATLQDIRRQLESVIEVGDE